MILAVLCAVGAMVLFGIAAVLQALATSRAVDVEVLDPRLLLRLSAQPVFLAALALNGLGFLLHITALQSLPLFLVQAVIAGSVAVTAVLSVRVFGVRLGPSQWGAVGLVVLGLVLLAPTATEGDAITPGAREPLVRDHQQRIASRRNALQPQDAHGRRGLRLTQLLPLVVVHHPNASDNTADEHRVTQLQRAVLHEHGGAWTLIRVHPGLDDHTLGKSGWVRLELPDVRHEQQDPQEVVDTGARERGHVDEGRVPTPVIGHQPLIGELLLHAVGICTLAVDLVHGDHDGHVSRLRVRECLKRLGHNAVVRGDHEHNDVGDLCTASAHGGERLVSRCVEERDLATLYLYLIGAYVLRDTAGFALHHVRLANRVEQAGLAVVDVSHHRDDGRARLQGGFSRGLLQL